MYTMLSTTHTNTCYVLLLLLTAPMQGQLQLLRGLGNFAQENTIADILIEDQLQSPLDVIIVDQEFHKSNS